MFQILIVVAMLAMTLLSQQSSPAVVLEPRGNFQHEMVTHVKGATFYVSDEEQFEGRYPSDRPERRRLERQVCSLSMQCM